MLKYHVLYTHQKKKKNKVWQDGTLRFNEQGIKGSLLSEDGQVLDVIYTHSRGKLSIGDELESDRYLVTIEDQVSPVSGCGQQHSTGRVLNSHHQKPVTVQYSSTNTRQRNKTDRYHHDYSGLPPSKRSVSQILGLLNSGDVSNISSSQAMLQTISIPDQSHDHSLAQTPTSSSSSSSSVFTVYPELEASIDTPVSPLPSLTHCTPLFPTLSSSSSSSSSSSCPVLTDSPPLFSTATTTTARSQLTCSHEHLSEYLSHPQQKTTRPAVSNVPGLITSDTVERTIPSPQGRWNQFMDNVMEDTTTAGYWQLPASTLGGHDSLRCTHTSDHLLYNPNDHHFVGRADMCNQQLCSGTSCVMRPTISPQQPYYRKLQPVSAVPSDFHSTFAESSFSRMKSGSNGICGTSCTGEVSILVLHDSLDECNSDSDGGNSDLSLSVPTSVCGTETICVLENEEGEEKVAKEEEKEEEEEGKRCCSVIMTRNRNDFKLGIWDTSSDSDMD